jgi:beta-glucosidase
MAFSKVPVVTRIEADVANRHLDFGQVSDHHRVEWTGFLIAPETGSYRIGLTGFNGEMEFDGRPFVDLSKANWNSLPTMRTVKLVKGRRYSIRVVSVAHVLAGVSLVWKRVSATPDADLRRAAADVDLLVAVVGLTSDLEAEETGVKVPGFEGGDKTTLDLPADQQHLLEAAKATGKPLVVVTLTGSPINLSWAKEQADALLVAWYPGQSGGRAIANVLTGKVNPAGRLPLTFYRGVDDLPPFGDYGMKGRTYRYYAGTPVYPFGYGLSYTSFAYAPLAVAKAKGGAETGVKVTTQITNTGNRAGDEVAQLYLDFPEDPGAPRLALRGFKRVSLKPGETERLDFDLSPRDLSAVTVDGRRRVLSGKYRVTIGSGQPGTAAAGQSAEFTVERAADVPR